MAGRRGATHAAFADQLAILAPDRLAELAVLINRADAASALTAPAGNTVPLPLCAGRLGAGTGGEPEHHHQDPDGCGSGRGSGRGQAGAGEAVHERGGSGGEVEARQAGWYAGTRARLGSALP